MGEKSRGEENIKVNYEVFDTEQLTEMLKMATTTLQAFKTNRDTIGESAEADKTIAPAEEQLIREKEELEEILAKRIEREKREK